MAKNALIATMLIVVAYAFAGVSPRVSAAGNVQVSHYGYFDPTTQAYYVIGEVENVGDAPITNVTVTANFYDVSDTFINSNKTYIYPGVTDYVNPWVLIPGAKAPFWPLTLSNQSGADIVDHYMITTSFQECAAPTVGLQLTLDTADIFDGNLHVNGTVKNTGTANADWVFVYATGYNATGVAFDYYYWFTEGLAPDQVAIFDVVATNFVYTGIPGQVQNYTVTAQSFTGAYLLWTVQYTAESDINGIIPEFSSALTVVLLMMAMTATVILCKKRQK